MRISRDNAQRLVYRKCPLLLDRTELSCLPSSRVCDVGFCSLFRFCEQTYLAITP